MAEAIERFLRHGLPPRKPTRRRIAIRTAAALMPQEMDGGPLTAGSIRKQEIGFVARFSRLRLQPVRQAPQSLANIGLPARAVWEASTIFINAFSPIRNSSGNGRSVLQQ
ncbi:MAG: hypothetical protein IPK39_24110 [Sulfuritalea sp.]|nr:hypothetical protein [Sulfuritalea sp.]